MQKNIRNIIPEKYKNYDIEKIEGGASKRIYYRLKKNNFSIILLDSSLEAVEFKKFLNVHKILTQVNISIPHIIESNNSTNTILLEDFGNLRFDKILNNFNLKDLLRPAIETISIVKQKIKFNKNYNLPVYNIDILKKEISEFIDFFYPYVRKTKLHQDLINEFYYCWEKKYNNINFSFNSFVHKDYNINNLFFLPNREYHKKCGVIDFQDAFWGEDCWDLFSLLEDSRVNFNDNYNDYFIKFYFDNTFQTISFTDFKEKYSFLNCSRQTRLLGRWIKLSKNLNDKWYLNFIHVTKRRLIKALNEKSMNDINILYKKIIPELYEI